MATLYEIYLLFANKAITHLFTLVKTNVCRDNAAVQTFLKKSIEDTIKLSGNGFS